ncbi:CaiB/BaiF CoA-transferase family protein [Bosea sp. (in: a-proteobacteria)]|uniref:CaiB/BaiF CoA-transferase family protein n=1 Tax=Bosea sp. (in: a-proteobacteria) TaxID=1871050 RepID=UPI002636177E|nr:CaiB/BaiF CoA-transferase family protein [Bosea sp. (in: a-proteobacteria)]MCO5089471.1 CoA transferase [Bosea sp. (in: a-proteobacteria)]
MSARVQAAESGAGGAEARQAAAAPFSMPLRGVRVVESGERLAVGVCGALLRELGAEVSCSGSYASAAGPAGYDGYAYLRHGKAILSGGALVAAESDADVALFSSDVAEAQAASSRDDGRRILCDITALGRAMAGSGAALTELQIQAMSAIVDTTGVSDGPPVPIGFPVVEMTTGLYAAAAVVAALRVRRQSGHGQAIDMSLFDCAFVAMATFVAEPLVGGETPIARMGNTHPSAAPWNTYRATDGSLVICAGNDQQWQRLCQLIGRPELAADPDFANQFGRVARRAQVDAAIQAWTERHSIEDCGRQLSAISIANGRVVRNDGFPREPNLVARGSVFEVDDASAGGKTYISRSPIRIDAASAARVEATGTAPSARSAASGPMRLPLHGVRVIEIGQYTTAPLVARYCAALGAEVIKVEPPGGESTRTWPPLLDGQSIFCRFNNSGKKMISLDLKDPQDAAIFNELVREADVVVENMKPGALAKLGFSFETMHAMNERLVYCSINGYGASSLYPGRPAYDTVIQAEAGIMAETSRDGEPVKAGISISDLLGAQFGLLGIIAALEYVAAGGPGVSLDISMQDASAWVTQLVWDGRARRPTVKTIPCSDGYVVAVEPRGEWQALPLDRFRQMTRAEADAELKRQGIEAAPVLSVLEMLKLPLVADRRLFDYRHDRGFAWPVLACPLRLMETPPRLMEPAAPVDFHRGEILGELRAANEGAVRGAAS